jgi:hypothetical protein
MTTPTGPFFYKPLHDKFLICGGTITRGIPRFLLGEVLGIEYVETPDGLEPKGDRADAETAAKLIVDALNAYQPGTQALIEQYGVWGEHPEWPFEDWAYQIAQQETRRSYWDWVAASIEANEE